METERGGTFQPETVREVPDLLAEYREIPLNIAGHVGMPDELLRLCPVDPADMTTQAKNDFMIKVMNKNGIEIKEEHAELFDESLARRGIEPSYKIRATEPQPNKSPAENVQTAPKERTISVPAATKESVRTETPTPRKVLVEPLAKEHVDSVDQTIVAADLARKARQQIDELLLGTAAEEIPPVDEVLSAKSTKAVTAMEHTTVLMDSMPEPGTMPFANPVKLKSALAPPTYDVAMTKQAVPVHESALVPQIEAANTTDLLAIPVAEQPSVYEVTPMEDEAAAIMPTVIAAESMSLEPFIDDPGELSILSEEDLDYSTSDFAIFDELLFEDAAVNTAPNDLAIAAPVKIGEDFLVSSEVAMPVEDMDIELLIFETDLHEALQLVEPEEAIVIAELFADVETVVNKLRHDIIRLTLLSEAEYAVEPVAAAEAHRYELEILCTSILEQLGLPVEDAYIQQLLQLLVPAELLLDTEPTIELIQDAAFCPYPEYTAEIKQDTAWLVSTKRSTPAHLLLLLARHALGSLQKKEFVGVAA